jgi:hypothetical protein
MLPSATILTWPIARERVLVFVTTNAVVRCLESDFVSDEVEGLINLG